MAERDNERIIAEQEAEKARRSEEKLKKQEEEEEEEGTVPPPGAGFHGRDYRKPKDTKGTLLRIFGYMGNSKLLITVVLLMVAASTACQQVSVYMMRPLIDDHILPFLRGEIFDFSGLASTLLFLGVIYILGSAISFGQSAIMVHVANRVAVKLREDLFRSLEKLPLSYFDAHTHGELMSRFTNDADNVQMLLEESIMHFVTSIISFAATLVIMCWINWRLFIITFCGIIIISILTKTFSGKSRILFKRQQAALGRLNGYVEEMVEGTKVVKAFNYEEQAREQFGELNEEYRSNSSRANFIGGLMMPIGSQTMNICYAITAAVGAIFAINSGFTIGALGTYLTYSKQVGMPIQQIANQLIQLMSAIAGAERIFSVMDEHSELDDGVITLVNATKDADGRLAETSGRTDVWAWKVPRDERLAKIDMRELGYKPDIIHHACLDYETDNEALLEARRLFASFMEKYSEYAGQYDLIEVRGDVRLIDVDFSYVEDKPVLKDVSVFAKPGQKIAFVGSTGAGKTTITNLINRFYDVDDGAITYDSIDIRDIKKDDLRSSLCMVLQDTHLFSTTIMENIRYGRLDATDEECVTAAKNANAHGFISRLPNGYDTEVTADGANLSQGQRQLIAIARAAVAAPPVMILDEATSSIDTRTEKLIEQGLDMLMENRTVFVIAHRLSTVRNSKAIAVIEHGEIIEKGTHHELLDREGRYYELYTGQTYLT